MLRRIVSLLLALSLLSGPAALAVDWVFPASGHPDVAYADMLPVEPYDETDLQGMLDELEALCLRHSPDRNDLESRKRASGLYRLILMELNVLVTRANLASIQYDASGGAEADAALYRELSAQRTRLYDRCYQVLASIAASPYGDILAADVGEDLADSLAGYQGLTEEEAARYEEEDRLVQDYDQIMSRNDPGPERDREAGEVFLQLARLRTATARQAGYDSYAAYAYEALYTRDYTLEDITPLREAAKKYLLPLQLRLLEEVSDQEFRALSVRSRKSGEEVLDAIQPFIEDFDREMGDTFAYMRRNHLYDIEYGEEKLPTGYTVALPEFYSAFIFNSPYGDYRDLSDMVHEFGHFHESFHNMEHDLWSDFNIDVGEIDSQALELMFTGYAPELFGERYGQIYEKAILYNILDAVLDGCLYDEFQEAAYADPSLSVEQLDVLFLKLSEEYGYSYDSDVTSDPSWVENAHTFQNPMYFISYATSALSALDLWFLYLDRPQEAKEIYLELSALSLSLPYRAAVEEVGLRDVFDPEMIPRLADMLEDHLDGKAVSYNEGGNSVSHIVMTCLALAFNIFCVTAIFFLVRFLNRHKGWKYMARPRRKDRPKDHYELEGDPEDPWSRKETKPPWEF